MTKQALIVSGFLILTLGLSVVMVTIPSGNNKGIDRSQNQTTTAPSQLASTEPNNENLVIIDVRTPNEYATGHLPKAINIDFYDKNFKDQINQLDKEGNYLVYCRSGNRSSQAIALMKELGFNNLDELVGGVLANKNLICQTDC